MERKIGTIMLIPGVILALIAAIWMTQIVVRSVRESGVLQTISQQAPSTGEDLYTLGRSLWDIVYGVPAGFIRAAAGKVTIILPGEGWLPSPSSVTYATPVPGYYGPPVMGPSAEGEVGPSGVSAEQEAETRAQTALNLLLACNASEAKTVAEGAIGYDPANQTALEVQAAAGNLVSLFTQLSAATTPATRGAVAAQILAFEFQGQPCAENPLAQTAKAQAETAVTAKQQADQAEFQHQLALQEFSAWLAASDYAPTGPDLKDHRWKEPAGPPSDAESLRKLAGNLVIKRTNAPGFVGVPRDSDVYAGDVVDPTTGSAIGSFIVNRKWLSSYTTWTGGGAGTVVQIKSVTPWPWGQQSLAPAAPGARGPSAVAPAATPTRAAPAAGLPPVEAELPALPPAITPTPVPTPVITALAPECAEVPNRATVDGTRPNCRRGLRLNPEQASSQFVLPDGHELLFGEAFPGVKIDGVLHTFVWAYYPPLDRQGWADYACLVPQGPITAGCQAPAPTPSPTPPWSWAPSPWNWNWSK